jgi:ABC-type amino acid transport substrate-binding protein
MIRYRFQQTPLVFSRRLTRIWSSLGLLIICVGVGVEVATAGTQPQESLEVQRPLMIGWAPFSRDEGELLDDKPLQELIDYWAVIANRQRIPFLLKRVDRFSDLMQAVENGRLDGAIRMIEATPERDEDLLLTEPVASDSWVVFTKPTQGDPLLALLSVFVSPDSLVLYAQMIGVMFLVSLPIVIVEQRKMGAGVEVFRSPRQVIRHLVFFLQKTLMLSTDHTTTTLSRLVSIISLFIRLLLAALFTSYFLAKLRNTMAGGQAPSVQSLADLRSLQPVAVLRGGVTSSAVNGYGIEYVTCAHFADCMRMVKQGQARSTVVPLIAGEWLLHKDSSVSGLIRRPGELRQYFIHFAFSKSILETHPGVFRRINKEIVGSYSDGLNARLQKRLSP